MRIVKDRTVLTLCAMACITFLAALYDGQILLLAVGLIGGMLVPSPFEKSERAETGTDAAERAAIRG